MLFTTNLKEFKQWLNVASPATETEKSTFDHT